MSSFLQHPFLGHYCLKPVFDISSPRLSCANMPHDLFFPHFTRISAIQFWWYDYQGMQIPSYALFCHTDQSDNTRTVEIWKQDQLLKPMQLLELCICQCTTQRGKCSSR